MGEFLDELGIEGRLVRWLAGAAIWFGFGFGCTALAAAEAAAEARLRIPGPGVVAIVVVVWVIWTYWHTVLLGRHRKFHLENSPRPYRRAFFIDLYPAMLVSFSQMLRPLLNGSMLGIIDISKEPLSSTFGLTRVVTALILGVFGGILFFTAWKTIGTARVGFVPEYVRTEAFEPVRQGPYSQVRHPLFWSGILMSSSLAFVAGTWVAMAVALVNFFYGLVYNVLEDRRLRGVFGQAYSDYADAVPRIVPRILVGGQFTRLVNDRSTVSTRPCRAERTYGATGEDSAKLT